jgi:solute carrier family 25 phosphate transporter 23/24/25/41
MSRNDGESPLMRQLKAMVAGAGSGAVTKTATAPLERLKILYQLQGMTEESRRNPRYGSMVGSLRLILEEEGVRGMFKGNGANVVRVIPVYALKFSFNDMFREMFRRPGQQQLGVRELILAGTSAGLFQQMITYPLELIRTRLSLSASFGGSYNGIWDCARRAVREEGFTAL